MKLPSTPLRAEGQVRQWPPCLRVRFGDQLRYPSKKASPLLSRSGISHPPGARGGSVVVLVA